MIRVYYGGLLFFCSMPDIRLPFDTSRNISGPLALLVVMLVASLVAWCSLSLGRQVIENAEHSPMVDISQRSSDIKHIKR